MFSVAEETNVPYSADPVLEIGSSYFTAEQLNIQSGYFGLAQLCLHAINNKHLVSPGST